MINAYIYPTPKEFQASLREPHCDPFLREDVPDPAAVAALSEDELCKYLRLLFRVKQNFRLERTNQGMLKWWVSHKGTPNLIKEMATPHLFYALRKVYNHTVAPVFRVLRPGEELKRYSDVPTWSADYRREVLNALVEEFKKRLELQDDLNGVDGDLKEQFDDIVANTNVIIALGI